MKSTKAALRLICGLPGSGKSTLAAELEKQHQAIRFNPDDWLMKIVGDGHNEKARTAIESIQWELAQKNISGGLDVILEFGFWSRAEREEYRAIAHTLGARTKLYFLDVPPTELKRRLERRNTNLPVNGFYVNPSLIDDWVKKFEAPTDEELDDR